MANSEGVSAGTNPVRSATREITRSARYAVVGVEPVRARRVWFVLHGYGQLAARFLRHFADVVPTDCCIVAPEGLSRFYLEGPKADGAHLQRVGASWLTREGRELEIHDTLRWLNTLHDDVVNVSAHANGERPTVGVLGFSQGVATMMRWVASGNVAPAHVVAWAGGFAHDVDANVLRARVAAARLTLVIGDRDEFANADTRAQALEQAQVFHPSPEQIVFDGAHHLDADILRTVLASL